MEKDITVLQKLYLIAGDRWKVQRWVSTKDNDKKYYEICTYNQFHIKCPLNGEIKCYFEQHTDCSPGLTVNWFGLHKHGCDDSSVAFWVSEVCRTSHFLPPLFFPLSIPFPQSCLPASTEVKSSGTTITAASYCLQGAVFTKDRLLRQAGKREREMSLRVCNAKGDAWCVV